MPFDRTQPFEEVGAQPASTAVLDKSKPFEDVDTGGRNFDPGAAILDPERAREHATPLGKAALDSLNGISDDESEKIKAVSQIYVQQHLKAFPARFIAHHWDAVRDSYAKSLGYTGGTISEGAFNTLLQQDAQKDKKKLWGAASPMERIKLMFGDSGISNPDLKVESALPAIGSEAAGTTGGAFTIPKMQGTGAIVGIINAVNKATSGLTAPENAGLLVATGGAGAIADIAESAKVIAVSKAAQSASLGTFAAMGAKDTEQGVANAIKITADPTSTHAQIAEAWADAGLAGAMTAFAAKGTYDFGKGAETTLTPEKKIETAQVLREEAQKAPTAEISATLTAAADHVEHAPEEGAIPEAAKETPAKEEPPVKAPEAPAIQPTERPTTGEPDPKGVDYGIAARVSEERAAGGAIEPIEPGKGISAEESVLHGRELLERGENPQTALEEFQKDGKISADQIALVRAQGETLNKAAYDAEVKFGPDSPEYKAAAKADSDWVKSIKPMQTEWHKIGQAQQGQTEMDTGTFHGINRAFQESTGREFTPKEAETAKKKVAKVQEATEGLKESLDKFVKGANDAADGKDVPAPSRALKYISSKAKEARARMMARMKEGRQYSGLDPQDFADSAIIGAEYIAKGVDKFADWSAAMVKEFGEIIKPHLDAIFAKAKETFGSAEDDQRAEIIQAKKKALESRIKELERKIKENDLSTPATKASRPSTEEIERLEQQRDALSADLSDMRDNAAKIKELKDAIAEKDKKIKEGDLSAKPSAVSRPSQPEIERLKQQRDSLNEKLDKLRQASKEKVVKTETEKVSDRLDIQIKELQRQIDSGEIFPKGNKVSPEEPSLQDKYEKLERLKFERDNLRETIQPSADREVKSTPAEIVATHVPGEKWTPQQAKALWQHAKEKYIDQGITDPHDIRSNLATDFGLDPDEIHKGLASSKGMREITDELYAKQAAQRRVINEAKRWVAEAKYPGHEKIFRMIPESFFNLYTFGHGTVWTVTHTGNQYFLPKATGRLFRELGRSFRLMGVFDGGAYHERMMNDLIRDPNFIKAKRAGLENDPYIQRDEYQNPGVVKMFKTIGLMGNRGFDGMKLFRQFRFNQEWNALPDSLKNADTAKFIANSINTATGAVPGKAPGGVARTIFFAPRLEMSRWKFMFTEPAMDANTIAKALVKKDSVTPEAYHAAQRNLRQKLTIAGTYFAALAINQGLLEATNSEEEVNFTDFRRGDWLDFKGFGKSVGVVSPMKNVVRFLFELGNAFWGQRTQMQKAEGTRASQAGDVAVKYARGKLSPFASVATDILTQSDYIGKPLPFSSDKASPTAKRMGEGKPYTYGEYAATHLLPIPLAESAREIWKEQGMTDEEVNKWLRAVEVGIAAGTTGAKVREDKPARH